MTGQPPDGDNAGGHPRVGSHSQIIVISSVYEPGPFAQFLARHE
jgi:hypothetical protein